MAVLPSAQLLRINSDSKLPLVPYPTRVEIRDVAPFALHSSTTLKLGSRVSEGSVAVVALRNLIDVAPQANFHSHRSAIYLDISEGLKSSYQLNISTDVIKLIASNASGLFYGVQTLKQLFNNQHMRALSLNIIDAPVFLHRGLHLDVSRHFFPAIHVKKLLNTMAFFKFNRFHWHLTDDQGWRLQVPGYPKLTAYGDSYTNEEIRDIVQYASDRFIEVVPEVDVPGHVAAAVAAYPELGNIDFSPPSKPVITWGVFPWTLSPTQVTVDFLDAVVDALIDLFPSQLIHMGGDEAPSFQWEGSSKQARQTWIIPENGSDDVQGFFNHYVGEALQAKGRRLAGWDEMQSHQALTADAVIFAWRSSGELEKAVMSGRSVVCCDIGFTYFDYIQGGKWHEPIGQPVVVTMRTVYDRCVEFAQRWAGERLVLGGQGQLWSEYIPTLDHLEYMAFPRSLALADCLWSGGQGGSYDQFIDRVKPQLIVLKADGVHFHNL